MGTSAVLVVGFTNTLVWQAGVPHVRSVGLYLPQVAIESTDPFRLSVTSVTLVKAVAGELSLLSG